MYCGFINNLNKYVAANNKTVQYAHELRRQKGETISANESITIPEKTYRE